MTGSIASPAARTHFPGHPLCLWDNPVKSGLFATPKAGYLFQTPPYRLLHTCLLLLCLFQFPLSLSEVLSYIAALPILCGPPHLTQLLTHPLSFGMSSYPLPLLQHLSLYHHLLEVVRPFFYHMQFHFRRWTWECLQKCIYTNHFPSSSVCCRIC